MKTLHVAMVMLAAGIGCASSESGVSPAGGGGAGGASAGSSGAGGGCAHDCLGGECKDGQCQPLALLSDVCPAGTSAELALTEGDLYFDYSPMCEATCASVPLVRMPTSGGARTTISDHFIPGRLVARDIAVYFQLTQYGGHADNPDGCDFVNNGLFSSDDSSDTSMPLAPWGVAGDTVELTVGADQLYLLAKGPGITPGHIDVVPLQGGVVQTLIPNLSEQGVGLLLTNDVNLFWMSQNTDGSYDMLTAPIGGAPVMSTCSVSMGAPSTMVPGIPSSIRERSTDCPWEKIRRGLDSMSSPRAPVPTSSRRRVTTSASASLPRAYPTPLDACRRAVALCASSRLRGRR
jgi:hypothetical protein